MRRWSRVILGLLLGAFLLCAAFQEHETPRSSGAARQSSSVQRTQEQAPAQPTFTTQTTEVELAVTVTDDRGKVVSDLTRDDFRVLDEGRPQRIEFFSHSDTQPLPIVVGFLVDLSSASKIHWKDYLEAINNLIWALLPDDKRYSGYLITYTHEAELAVNTTTDGSRLTDRLRKLKPGGGSALYDAVYLACERRKIMEGEPYEPRSVIVIIGGGQNNAGSHTLAEVVELAKRRQTTIYAMSTVAYGMDNPDQGNLEKLTSETGGYVERPLSNPYREAPGHISTPTDGGNYAWELGAGGYAAAFSKSILDAASRLRGEITTQYVLRYRPEVDPATASKVYRRVRVELPKLRDVKIRTKDGYYPFPPGAPAPSAPEPAQPK